MKLAILGMDLGIAVIFLLMGYGFYKSNGKASKFIAGYNSKSDDERKEYNEKKLCQDIGRSIMIWSSCFFIGFIIDFFWVGAGSVIGWVMWIVLFTYYMIDMNKNEEKKYKR